MVRLPACSNPLSTSSGTLFLSQRFCRTDDTTPSWIVTNSDSTVDMVKELDLVNCSEEEWRRTVAKRLYMEVYERQTTSRLTVVKIIVYYFTATETQLSF